MKLEIVTIDGKKDYNKEVVWLRATEDCDLKNYSVSDTTYNSNNTISNKLRHTFWFYPCAVKKGDYVKLFTRDGADTSLTNDKGTTTHVFFWGLKVAIWNNDGDCAVLFEHADWKTTRS